MVKPVVQSGSDTLRIKSKPVKKIDKKIKQLIKDLKDTLENQSDPEGVGLAAPQIGKNLRVFVMREKNITTTIINPKIIKRSKRESKTSKEIMEGCLSLPHYYGPLTRAAWLVLEYVDEYGEKQQKRFRGFQAQIVQHEIDHLNGILFVDRLLENKKPLYKYQGGEWERVELDL